MTDRRKRMSETAGIEQEIADPVLLWEGPAAMFATLFMYGR